jgi:hypothetical protein
VTEMKRTFSSRSKIHIFVRIENNACPVNLKFPYFLKFIPIDHGLSIPDVFETTSDSIVNNIIYEFILLRFG